MAGGCSLPTPARAAAAVDEEVARAVDGRLTPAASARRPDPLFYEESARTARVEVPQICFMLDLAILVREQWLAFDREGGLPTEASAGQRVAAFDESMMGMDLAAGDGLLLPTPAASQNNVAVELPVVSQRRWGAPASSGIGVSLQTVARAIAYERGILDERYYELPLSSSHVTSAEEPMESPAEEEEINPRDKPNPESKRVSKIVGIVCVFVASLLFPMFQIFPKPDNAGALYSVAVTFMVFGQFTSLILLIHLVMVRSAAPVTVQVQKVAMVVALGCVLVAFTLHACVLLLPAAPFKFTWLSLLMAAIGSLSLLCGLLACHRGWSRRGVKEGGSAAAASVARVNNV